MPKSLLFLGNFCKGVKIYHFSSEIIFGQLLQTFGVFSGHTGHHLLLLLRLNIERSSAHKKHKNEAFKFIIKVQLVIKLFILDCICSWSTVQQGMSYCTDILSTRDQPEIPIASNNSLVHDWRKTDDLNLYHHTVQS